MTYVCKKFGEKRIWLNTGKSALACMAWSVSGDYYDTDSISSVNADLIFKDCSRSVNLEFFCEPPGFKEKLKKVDKIIDQLNQFRAALVAAMEIEE